MLILTAEPKKSGLIIATNYTFINPKCGHEISYTSYTPFKCPTEGCDEKIPFIEKLHTSVTGQGNRVKYYLEGTV